MRKLSSRAFWVSLVLLGGTAGAMAEDVMQPVGRSGYRFVPREEITTVAIYTGARDVYTRDSMAQHQAGVVQAQGRAGYVVPNTTWIQHYYAPYTR